MTAYINGLACISHHNTINDDSFFENLTSLATSNKLIASEPVYKEYIPIALIRRMSRVVKMGLTAAMMSMKKADLEKIDAIVVGTGIGCYEDTDKFLRALLDYNEQLLTPTAFIQSTHNTVAGQIALTFKCHGYNFTYVHQNLSFEYALLDGMMLLDENEATHVLVGAIDEITESLFELFNRTGKIKKTENLQTIWNSLSNGYIAGEGATFFNISSEQSPLSLAKIRGVKCKQQIEDADELMQETELFLSEIGLQRSQIALVLSGNCGDEQMDKKISSFNMMINLPIGYFKLLCGEYLTSSGFAMWLAATIIKKQIVPKVILSDNKQLSNIKHILIVNHYHDKQYSFMCVSSC
jgi:hypothetical protein